MYHQHSPKGWDHWSRVMGSRVEFLRKDATFVPEARSPTVRRRELGALLRKLRTEKGLTVEQAAERLLFSMSKLSRMETGHGVATPRDIRDLCDLYGVADDAEREHLTHLAREGKQQAWWQSYDLGYATYVGLEAEAVALSAFQSSVAHGLLHTADYARAGHEGAMPRLSPDQIEMQIEAKLTRQRILTRDNPPRFSVVLDEAALHRVVGGRRVMAAQLAKILDMSAWPNVTVQVLPYEIGAHPAVESNFTILELPNPTPGVVFVEGLIGSTYLERDDDLTRYQMIFHKLESIALSPKGSIDLIKKLLHDYKSSLEAAQEDSNLCACLATGSRKELRSAVDKY
jgi:transcriptional regulator with XRE-family HTH domain